MIPYDDLVAALAAWRARQGLPVAQSVAAAAPLPGRARPTPPSARPAARIVDAELDAGALVEDSSYDTGEDYVMQLGAVEQPGEPTAISSAPEPGPSARGKRPGW
ncbi:MAG TPA: hypothetical protein VK601_00785 [Kofleriaceae bacterium]|nr:hypothetical protein [Kofleriaceae bacterium]